MADIIALESLGDQTGITDNLSVILGSSALLVDDTYNGKKIDVIIGTLVMTRTITDYTGLTKKAVLNAALDQDPSSVDTYRVYEDATSAFEIDVAMVKLYMGIKSTETKYDTLIEDAIAAAYGKLDNYTGYDPDTGIFSEYNDGLVKNQIFASGIASDIVLSKVEIDGVEIDLTTDLSKTSFNHWEVINDDYLDAEMFYVEYSSERLLAKINRILLEIIIYEMKKLPGFEDSINRKSRMIDDVITEQFISEQTFYNDIDKKMTELFLRKL